jgi:pyruvate/2-oxoglutarate dehydrogenase complex dihydrolipoamide dehydrogenase (E3) component
MDTMYDLVVIGAGSAGLVAAPFAAAAGARVLLVEKDRIGGDCTWTGCVPSKALIHAAGIIHRLREIAFVSGGGNMADVDFARVMERVRAAVEGVYAAETPEALARQGVAVAFGAARFVDGGAITLDGRRVAARHFMVCTGAEPVVPPIPGLAEAGFLTYKDVFSLAEFPRRLLVLGSGPVGIELAQAFGRLGSEVHLFEAADRLLPVADPAASEILLQRFTREGVLVHLNCPVERVEKLGTGVALIARGARVEGDRLLIAVGRRPRFNGLDLDRASVASAVEGISVDAQLRSSNPRVYAAGDAAGSLQFTHYAGWQGYVAARNALFPGAAHGKRDGVPWVVFTDPEVGQVGLTEEEARGRGLRPHVLRLPLDRIDRAQTTGELEGFIKLVSHDSRLVGATVVAPAAGEVINECALAIRVNATMGDLSSTIHVYPTYGIGIQQLASRAAITGFTQGWQGRLLARLMRRSRKADPDHQP